MKIAILYYGTHPLYGHLAMSLGRLLATAGAKTVAVPIFHFPLHEMKEFALLALRLNPRKFLGAVYRNCVWWKTIYKLASGKFDAVVVTGSMPWFWSTNILRIVALLRRFLEIPILFHGNYYPGTRGPWLKLAMQRSGGIGLDAYDGYLASSTISEYPLPEASPHPVYEVGLDMRAPMLRSCHSGEFRVLLDFPQPLFPDVRTLQIQALEDLHIPFTCLDKGRQYPVDVIRDLYATHHALMLSTRESFCLPIVEMQLCGGLIFTPYKAWAPSHYINPSYERDPAGYIYGRNFYVQDNCEVPINPLSDTGSLGRNFRVYQNNLATLKECLLEAQQSFDAAKNECYFREDYPQLYSGNFTEAARFLEDLEKSRIKHTSHQEHVKLNETVIDHLPEKAAKEPWRKE